MRKMVYRLRKLKGRRHLRTTLFSLVVFLLLIRNRLRRPDISRHTERTERIARPEHTANWTFHRTEIGPRHTSVATSRVLTTDSSSFARIAKSGFPRFYACATPVAACVPAPASPSVADAVGSAHLTFVLTRAGCTSAHHQRMIRVRAHAAHHNMSLLYTLQSLRATDVNFYDAPLALIGTSRAHSWRVPAGAVAEFATHVAAWRETFAQGAAPALVLAGAVPALRTWQRLGAVLATLPTWHVVVVSARSAREAKDVEWVSGDVARVTRYLALDDMDSYVVSTDGANRLLSKAAAFVRPLPEYFGALMRKQGEDGGQYLSVLRFYAGDDGDMEGEEECARPLRSTGAVVWSHELPFYPPHHELYEIRD